MKTLLSAVACLVLGALCAGAIEDKTDLTKESFVEASKTDFVLSATNAASASKQIMVFNLAADVPGAFTVLCFVDGRLWTQLLMDLPGEYKLGTRGMVPGEHRVTLQAVDAAGRVGSATQTTKVGTMK